MIIFFLIVTLLHAGVIDSAVQQIDWDISSATTLILLTIGGVVCLLVIDQRSRDLSIRLKQARLVFAAFVNNDSHLFRRCHPANAPPA